MVPADNVQVRNISTLANALHALNNKVPEQYQALVRLIRHSA